MIAPTKVDNIFETEEVIYLAQSATENVSELPVRKDDNAKQVWWFATNVHVSYDWFLKRHERECSIYVDEQWSKR